MKYLFAVVLSVFFVGCTVSLPMKETRIFAIDFRPYTASGFLFTTETYKGEYESIAILSTTIFPEVIEVKDKKAMKGTKLSYNLIEVKEVIDSVYSMAKNMGADAVMRFEAKPVQKVFTELIIQGVEVNGFAIKRKQPLNNELK